jgi:hypothetical protein
VIQKGHPNDPSKPSKYSGGLLGTNSKADAFTGLLS